MSTFVPRAVSLNLQGLQLSSRGAVRHSVTRSVSSIAQCRIAVLYQALEPPVISGVKKPKKPGGYQDSGADIAYILKNNCGVSVVTPANPPDAASDGDWCFPDTEDGILKAVTSGANHIWANTILFATHPLQESEALGRFAESVSVVGQPPSLVEAYDDKALVYEIMKSHGGLTITKSTVLTASDDIPTLIKDQRLQYPLVAKPVRGRGSHGVKLCENKEALQAHANYLFSESPKIIVEEYLSGEEVTVTVMPPSASRPGRHSALPIVSRFNHSNGIAPYNGSVAVTSNSQVVNADECSQDPAYGRVVKECEDVAALLKATTPIRIDARRFKEGSIFALFDVNMKPNMTGPGRPGREDQASLTAMAAEAFGWTYGRLLTEILASAQPLAVVRSTKM